MAKCFAADAAAIIKWTVIELLKAANLDSCTFS